MANEEVVYSNLLYSSPAFEGASLSYRQEQRGLLAGSSDTLAARELLMLQLRISHAIRNNGNARTARDKFVTNLGMVEVKWKDSKKKEHKKMQEYWDEFCANPSLDGYGNFNNIFDTWKHEFFQSGAAITRKHIRRNGNSNRIPLKLQPIPTEYLDVYFNGDDATGKTKFGITFFDTKPTTYHFRQGLLDSTYTLENPNPFNRISVPSDEILHIFIREQAGQWLGIPFLAAVLVPLYELDELSDATLAKQKAAQAISWIIENTNPLAMTPTGVPTMVKDANQNDKVIFKTNGGNVQYLNKGESIKFWQSTDIGANLLVLIQTELRRIAATCGIPYYQLTGDTSGLDFSSLRAIAIELRIRVEYILNTYFIPLGLNPLAMYFKELVGLYDRKITQAFPYYQLPRWYGVDDLKDAQADLLEVQSGFSTLESKLAERQLTFEQLEEDRKKIKEAGLEHLLTGASNKSNQINNNNPNSNSTGN